MGTANLKQTPAGTGLQWLNWSDKYTMETLIIGAQPGTEIVT